MRLKILLPGFLVVIALFLTSCGVGGEVSTGPPPFTTQTPATDPGSGLINLNFVNGVSSNSIRNFSPQTKVYMVVYARDFSLPRPSFSYAASLSSKLRTSSVAPSAKNVPVHLGRGRSFTCGTPFATRHLSAQRTDISSYKPVQRKDAEGESRDFYLNSFMGEQVRATCRKVGVYCCVYVQNSEWGKGAMTQSSVSEFQRWFDEIYPRMHAAFGEEQPIGVNGDTKVTVLFNSNISQVIYDMLPKNEQIPYSNERKMFYVESLPADIHGLEAVSAHEFFHLIEIYQKYIKTGQYGDDPWLSEALAMGASELMEFPQDVTFWFCEKPYCSLTDWNHAPPSPGPYDYAVAGMFASYLIRHYTNNLCFNIVNNDKLGIEAVNAALSASGYTDRFPDVFRKWIAANCLYKCNTQGTPYNYPAATYTWTGGGVYHLSPMDIGNFAAPPGSPDELLMKKIYSYPMAETYDDYPAAGPFGPWAAEYFEFSGGDGSTLNLTVRRRPADNPVEGMYTVVSP